MAPMLDHWGSVTGTFARTLVTGMVMIAGCVVKKRSAPHYESLPPSGFSEPRAIGLVERDQHQRFAGPSQQGRTAGSDSQQGRTASRVGQPAGSDSQQGRTASRVGQSAGSDRESAPREALKDGLMGCTLKLRQQCGFGSIVAA